MPMLRLKGNLVGIPRTFARDDETRIFLVVANRPHRARDLFQEMARRRRSDHWLNTHWWILTLGEWIGLVLALGAIVSLLCILLIRRHTLEYHLEHTFAVGDPEFLGSALAMSDPVPIEGNAIEVLQNGDEYFPAMLDAIRAAKKTVNFEAYIVYSDEIWPGLLRSTVRTCPSRPRSAGVARRCRLELESE